MVRLKGFEKLTRVDDALQIFLSKMKLEKFNFERTQIQESLGRITQKNVIAQNNLPLFNRSAVDGYAVKAKDTFGVSSFNPKIFSLTKGNIHENEASELWTGNPIPKGSDAVVMLEYTKKTNDKIIISKSVTPGRNVSTKGEDVKKGAIAIKAGTRLNPHHIGLLAGIGETHVNVVKKPKVAILATGNELVELGKDLEFGKIVETNRLVFSALSAELGAEPINLGLVEDKLDDIIKKINDGLEKADVIITTGGTSVGYPDLVPMAINKIGKPGIIIHGIAIRPGMPTALAILDNKPIFILSGNPVAASVGFEIFVRPIILKLMGISETKPIVIAKLTRRVAGVLGRKIFLRVKVFEKNNNFFADPIRVTGSGILTTMTRANGYVLIPENREGIEENESVRVHLFSSILSD